MVNMSLRGGHENARGHSRGMAGWFGNDGRLFRELGGVAERSRVGGRRGRDGRTTDQRPAPMQWTKAVRQAACVRPVLWHARHVPRRGSAVMPRGCVWCRRGMQRLTAHPAPLPSLCSTACVACELVDSRHRPVPRPHSAPTCEWPLRILIQPDGAWCRDTCSGSAARRKREQLDRASRSLCARKNETCESTSSGRSSIVSARGRQRSPGVSAALSGDAGGEWAIAATPAASDRGAVAGGWGGGLENDQMTKRQIILPLVGSAAMAERRGGETGLRAAEDTGCRRDNNDGAQTVEPAPKSSSSSSSAPKRSRLLPVGLLLMCRRYGLQIVGCSVWVLKDSSYALPC